MRAVYLDNCATTKVCGQAAQKAMEAMTEVYGNPSSLHTMGIRAEQMLRQARLQIAQSLKCTPEEIIFTSGGTESNNLAVFGAAQALRRRGKRIVTTMIEHPSVARAMDALEKEGFEVIRLRPGPDGAVTEGDLLKAVTSDTILVSMMLVNNETGAIQPVEAARRAVKAAGAPALIHCDAVQAYGRLKVLPAKLEVDLLTVSGHKIHAPKGAGTLYIAKGARVVPVTFGGGQERGIRSGTEATPALAAFGEATRVAFERFDDYAGHMRSLRAFCMRRLGELPLVVINSPPEGAPHILNISVSGVRSETMLHYLAEREIYISSGSACSKGKKSSVLAAQGLPDPLIDSALRISFSRDNTESDVEALVQGIADGLQALAHIH